MRKILSSIAIAWLLLAVSCAPRAPSTSTQVPSSPTAARVETMSLEDQAAQEATVIVAQARATALVMEAQAQATALLQQAEQPGDQNPQVENESQPAFTLTPEAGPVIKPTLNTASIVETGFNDVYAVELIDVGYAAEGGFIIVNFKATKLAVDDFWPGRLSLVDETTGTVYDEVATMPLIGPLIGRPREAGQPGYVMFVNTPPGLPSNTLVTVVLGQFKQEHVSIHP